jgi:hypothetical protein
MQLPVYLDAEVQTYFSKRAEKKGKSLDALLNEILKKEIALIETIEFSSRSRQDNATGRTEAPRRPPPAHRDSGTR